MEQGKDPTWAQAAPDDNGMGLDMHDDDFADLLNLDNLEADFSNYGNLENDENIAVTSQPFGDSLRLTSEHDFASSMPYFELSQTNDGRQSSHQQRVQPHPNQQRSAPLQIHHHGQRAMDEAQHAAAMQAGLMNHALPTPNSAELYAGSANYLYQQQQQQARFAQQQQRIPPAFSGMSIDPNTLTPYESPGLDGSQSAVSYIPEYAVPSSFALSPLSSPAIHPQMQHGQIPRSNPRTAASSVVNSPSVERFDLNAEPGQEERPRKSRKKTTPVTRAANASTRTRKGAASRSKEPSNVRTSTRNKGQGGLSSFSAKGPKDGDKGCSGERTASGSLNSSMSPQPASEFIMAPPPKPQGSSHAPVKTDTPPQKAVSDSSNPATPTSIMRTKPGNRSKSDAADENNDRSPTTGDLESGMEYLQLPEAAASPSNSSSNAASGADSSIQLAKPPTSTGHSNEASESPRPGSAVTSPSGPAGVSQNDEKFGRGTKKRNSSSSNLVSPAIRPKVSPGMKPLLPEGTGMDPQTQALLLASRSNYENILSGNHLPGVSYPADLGANLTSKRTSHKLAEQGRRNRINEALKEMQTLLPPKFTAGTTDNEGSGSGGNEKKGSKTSAAAQTGNSKAATVENAIDYIKFLQEEMQKKDGMIQQLNAAKKT